MPIETLRNEIETLNREIAEWRGEIELIEDRIEDAYAEISEKEAEIERIEAEDTAMNELRQIVNGGEIMGRDAADIRAIIDFIRNGPRPASDTEVLHNLSRTRTVVVNTETGEETEITPEMENGYMTIVGTSHQDLWTVENYTPLVGELVRLDKESSTANCFGILICPDDEDRVIGVLPTNAGDKPEELAEVGLPCICHQDVWGTDDLNKIYEVVGAVPGKYVVIKPHIADEEPEIVEESAPEPETEAEIIVMPEEQIDGAAVDIPEAKRLFATNKPSTCTIYEVIDRGEYFHINYLNHERNDNPFCECRIEKA